MKCRVVLFYMYSSPQINWPNTLRSLVKESSVSINKEPQEKSLSASSSSSAREGGIKTQYHHHTAQGILVPELTETLLKYASWYCIFLAPNSQILLKGVALSKGTSESRWSGVISTICSSGGKVLKISLSAALRNVCQWEEEAIYNPSDMLSVVDSQQLIEYGERPFLQNQRSGTRKKRNNDSDDDNDDDDDDGNSIRPSSNLAETEEDDYHDQVEEETRRRRKKKPRLSVDDVIQASNLSELCEKKGIVQEKLSAIDYCQYIKTRKLLEKQNEIPPQYQSGLFSSGGKRDAPFEYSPFFEWQRSLLERMISKRPPDDKRKIIFLVDPIGNNGKSVFFQWLSSLPAGAINKYLLTPSLSHTSSSSRVAPELIHRTDDSIISPPPPQKEFLSSHADVTMIIKEEEEDLKERININQDFEEEHIQKENCMPTSENNNNNNSQQQEIPSEEIHGEESCHSRKNNQSPGIDDDDDDDDENNSLLSLKDRSGAVSPPPPLMMMMMNIEFQYLTIEGKGSKSSSVNDILYLVDCSQANCNTTQSIFLVDLARCEAQNLNYALLEKLKNGAWMSTKYEGKKASYKNGQVIVAMNELPDVTKLSQDRYEIYLLHDKKFAFAGKPIPVHKIPATRKLHTKFLHQLLTLL